MLGKNGIKAVQVATSTSFNTAWKWRGFNFIGSLQQPSLLLFPSAHANYLCRQQKSQYQQADKLLKYDVSFLSPETAFKNHRDGDGYTIDQIPQSTQQSGVHLPFIHNFQVHNLGNMELIRPSSILQLIHNHMRTVPPSSHVAKAKEHFRTRVSVPRYHIDSNYLPSQESIFHFSNVYYCMNRNARRGKRANKGKRPCSHQHRRKRRRRFGSHRR
jgi:hypothetical protein